MSARNTTKTEHTGAKNRGGFWGLRIIAKRKSRKLRRQADRTESASEFDKFW